MLSYKSYVIYIPNSDYRSVLSYDERAESSD